MTGLVSLWLPILLSAVLVFVVSSIIHMVSPWHKSDDPRIGKELDHVVPVLVAADAFAGAVAGRASPPVASLPRSGIACPI